MRLIDYDRLEEYAAKYQERDPRNPLTRGDFKLIDNFLFECTLMKDITITPIAQEPRVMTLEEIQQHNNQDGCIWFEQPSYNAVAAFVTQDGEEFTELISPYLLGLPINHRCMVNRFYGLTWRCWTSRPTVKQMEAIPWN